MDNSLDKWIALHPLRAWCLHVLPTIFDESMSNYEILCKVIEITNGNIHNLEILKKEFDVSQEAIAQLQVEVDKLMSGDLSDIIQEAIDKAIRNVWFGLNTDGHFVAYIPENWSQIQFNTTGYDITVPNVGFGHLVLSEREGY